MASPRRKRSGAARDPGDPAPASWRGHLVHCRAQLEMDPGFARDLRVDALHPLRVRIQLEGDEHCAGVVVKNRTATAFERPVAPRDPVELPLTDGQVRRSR